MLKRLHLIFKKLYYYINYKKINPKINYSTVNKLLLVAHPDDELIFLGNRLFIEKDWLVICMTNGDSVTRSKEFINLMNELKLQYKILNFKDGINIKWNDLKVKKVIFKIVSSKDKWKMIVTHNNEGEYGHIQHKQLNRLVNETCKEHEIRVFCKKKNLVNKKNKLSIENMNKKIYFATNYYKSQHNIIRDLYENFEYEGIENL